MAIINVSNAAQLNTALTTARGGDTISLAAGNYGNVSISSLRATSAVVIKSADAANPAHFDTLTVRTSQNLTFRGLDIGRGLAAGEPEHVQLAAVRDSSNIIFDSNFIHGSLDGNPQNDAYGLFIDGATAVTVVNNTFKELTRGALFSTITNLRVANNSFFDLRSDAIDTDESQNVLFENNLFKGFYPLEFDHPDAIQFQNLNSTLWTENVTIRNNMLLPGGTGGGPQGIWISDPGTTGFRNFHIENNLLWGQGLYNGIGLYGVEGAKVIGNTVLSPTNDDKMMWIRVNGSSNVDLIRNVAEEYIIQGGVTNLRQIDNVNLRTSPGFRALMLNAENPSGWADVRLSNVGALLPITASNEAPVSGAAGNALKNVISPVTGQSIGQMLAVELASSDELDLSRVADLVSAARVEPATPAPVETPMYVAEPVPFHIYARDPIDSWFVALP